MIDEMKRRISPLLVLRQSLRSEFLLVEGELQSDHWHCVLVFFDVLDEILADHDVFLKGRPHVDHLRLPQRHQLILKVGLQETESCLAGGWLLLIGSIFAEHDHLLLLVGFILYCYFQISS